MVEKVQVVKPVKMKDGTWDVILEEREEDIPDLGRPDHMCNICGFGKYPECKEWCTAYLPQTMKSRSQNK